MSDAKLNMQRLQNGYFKGIPQHIIAAEDRQYVVVDMRLPVMKQQMEFYEAEFLRYLRKNKKLVEQGRIKIVGEPPDYTVFDFRHIHGKQPQHIKPEDFLQYLIANRAFILKGQIKLMSKVPKSILEELIEEIFIDNGQV